MKGTLPCAIVRDLLPSYIEGLTEPETTSAVKEHLDTCADCRRRYEAMHEAEELPDTQKEVDYLKTVRRKNRKKIVLSAAAAAVLILAAVCVKLFWIGNPCDGNALYIHTELTEDRRALVIEMDEMNSGYTMRGVRMETEGNVTGITARETLALPFGGSSFTTWTVPLDGIREVEVCGMPVWQDGLMIDFQTNRLMNAKVTYVGDAPAMGQLLSAMDLDAPGKLELQTAREPYGAAIHFSEAINENRRFLMEGNAYILLALVDNLGEAKWDDPSGYQDALTLAQADAALPGLVEQYNAVHGTELIPLDSVKDYGADRYSLQILRNVLGI